MKQSLELKPNQNVREEKISFNDSRFLKENICHPEKKENAGKLTITNVKKREEQTATKRKSSF